MKLIGALFVTVAALSGCALEMDNEAEVDQEVLGPPSSVTIETVAADRVNLSWTAVGGALKYYVYQSTNMNGPYAFVNTARAPQTSIQIAHLTAGQNYCFIIQTEDGTGPGGSSTPVCTLTKTGQPPSTVIAYPASTTSVKVDWSSVEGASKYYIYRSGALNGTYSYVTTVFSPTLTYLNSGLTAGTYCYKVASDVGGIISSLSNGHCNTSFQPPQNVTATRTSSTRIQLAWSPATNATKYYVYESRNGGAYANVTSVTQSASPTVIRANLTTGAQYCYRIQSVNAANQTSPLSLQPACATP
jgi:fibronectin type 3 domain-containing protein